MGTGRGGDTACADGVEEQLDAGEVLDTKIGHR
jgi:hypothetical protein